jgi:hypothetical protein
LDRRAYASSSIQVGAIRWDAWDAANTSILKAVETSLGPHQYRDRAPFCATAPSAESIEFSKCDTQAAMDREIAAAAQAGLAYWAYCWYSASDPMMNAWALHQTSTQKNRVNWCMILQIDHLAGAAAFTGLASTYVSYFRQGNYQRVAGGRPLVYLFVGQLQHLTSDWGGSWANVGAAFDNLRALCAKAGLKRPYIVVMTWSPGSAYAIQKQIGGDAISNYVAPVPEGRPASYEALCASTQAYWDEMAATGSPVVPICMTGWDTRPRKQHPPPWSRNQQPNVGMDTYVAAGTPAQIAEHVRSAIFFVQTHPERCPAQTVLIYSWNECDEGGSALIPAYGAHGVNHGILDAVGDVLHLAS